MQDSVI